MVAQTVSGIVERIDDLLIKWQKKFSGKTLTELEKEEVLEDLAKKVNIDLFNEGYTSKQISDAWVIWCTKKGRSLQN